MTFGQLAVYLERLEKTASRNEITQILADLFKETKAAEIDKVCYLILGELVPSYQGIELNLAEKMMIRVLAQAYAVGGDEVTKAYKASGDLGDVAQELKAQSSKRKTKALSLKLSVTEVYERLMDVARESGAGSQERKISRMTELLLGLDPLSAKFVARIPVGKLRLGFSDITIMDALSVMETGDKKARTQIETAFNVVADIGKIAYQVKSGGIKSLEKAKATPGVPIRPALAERLNTIEDIFKKQGAEVGVEPKLDGFRTQIHMWTYRNEKQVMLFSRNLENTTPMFPEIVEAAKKLPVESVILDTETIGYNSKTGKFLPFQETVSRKRKHDIEEMTKKLPLYAFAFDVLYLDGKSLLNTPFRERRKSLEKVLKNDGVMPAPPARAGQAGIKLDEHILTSDPLVVAKELKEKLAAGLEGLVTKKLDEPYRAGGRGFHWIKIKANTSALAGLREGSKKAGLPDTIDCLVMGAYRGRGKRAGFGVGGFLLGVREGDKFYTISRLGTGLSDEQFREANRRVQKIRVASQPKVYVVQKEISPDIWIKPGLVLENLADEITPSPRHTAVYSLRFPRLVRFRDDKNPQDATTVKEVEQMYALQRR
ncbi:ATP-dependent DNA ligase [Candidatus Microgenomates bacterium]|nr:ATP-dependent DNA ligase [Candidatus Microgenomates bacterium]